MAAKPFHLSPKATQDLEGIWFYTFDNWSRAQADRYHHDLMAEIAVLASGKRKGRTGTVRPGLMKRTCGSHVIWYRDLPDRLEVIRVLHSAQDTERHLHD
ncbi:MAG: type II toxin-antitoxin system RelE/ParE family toxin [Tabrizicola sp.]|jgi:toxin ParE1/3/4|uniref:type II toxin-antitoxin system RelE/ParE family toxin n=1 Tax=Tabrizicola sp. TaxID=2005166 RepID=UPI003BB1824D